MKYFIFSWLILFSLLSCGADDDICLSGEATPRMKLKFKTQDNRLTRVPRIIVGVDYGNGERLVVDRTMADSILIPIRVDNVNFTDVFVRTSETGATSRIRLNFSSESQYVSPACGFKKTYRNLTSTLQTSNPVTKIEQNQTDIIDEKGTHLFLVF